MMNTMTVVWIAAILFLNSVLALAQATTPAATDPLDLNPATGCMEGIFAADLPEAERIVPAEAVMESLRTQNCLRLVHAIVQGDLDLSDLPTNGVGPAGEDWILIPGAFVIKDSILTGEFHAGKVQGGPGVWFVDRFVLDGTKLGGFDAAHAIFSSETSFEDSEFSRIVKLDGTRFDRGASFAGASFLNPVFLTRVRFAGELDLKQTTFASLVRGFGLNGDDVNLEGATFQTTTDFSSWKVNNLHGNGAHFEQAVDFKNGLMRGVVNFDRAVFSGNVDFSGSVFQEAVSFHGTNFAKNAYFSQSAFRNSVDFARSKFELSALFDQSSFFDLAFFDHVGFEFLGSFDRTRFYQWVDFGSARFQRLAMPHALLLSQRSPNWAGAEFLGEIDLEGLESYSRWISDSKQLNAAFSAANAYVNAGQAQTASIMGYTIWGIALGIGALLLLQWLS